MRRVSYQGMLGAGSEPPAGVYVRLGDETIATRRKDARTEVRFEVSKAQARWLRDAVEMSGPGIDETGFERRLADYVEKHTGVRLAKLKPRPPED